MWGISKIAENRFILVSASLYIFIEKETNST